MYWPDDPSLQPPMTVRQQLIAIQQAAANDNQPAIVALANNVLGLEAPVTPHPEAAVHSAWVAAVAVPPQWGTVPGDLAGIQ